MCVLIYKPKGKILPTYDTLKLCYDANFDGCGFATLNGVIYKSLNFNDFYNQLITFTNINDDIMIHFRLATHGSVKQTNCHPFFDKRFIFAHNGILPIASKNDKTDSELYFKQLLPLLYEQGLKGQIVKNYINSTIGFSKFCIFDTEKKQIKLFGTFEKYGSCFFSNMRWLQRFYFIKKYVS